MPFPIVPLPPAFTYHPKTEKALRALPPLTAPEWARLCLACADQAGVTVRQQDKLQAMLLTGDPT